jgi:hypothetical protein
LAAAEARGDEKMALTALCIQAGSLAGLARFDRAAQIADDALRRAKRSGHPTMITAAVITAAGLYSGSPLAEPDFPKCLEILTQDGVGLSRTDMSGMWLDLMEASARLGLDRRGAIESYVRAAHTADLLNAHHVLDIVLRGLAIIAAEAGLAETAHALVAYTESTLGPYRIVTQTWMQDRLDRALAPLPQRPNEPVLHRSDILQLVTEVETALAPGERRGQSTTA